MGELLLITPPDWLQLDWAQITSSTDLSTSNVLSYINANMLEYIEIPLKEAGLISDSSILVEAKLIDDTYFLVKLS